MFRVVPVAWICWNGAVIEGRVKVKVRKWLNNELQCLENKIFVGDGKPLKDSKK